MKIARQEFTHPAGGWSKSFLWWDTVFGKEKKETSVWVANTMSEVREQVMAFVNDLRPDRLVSINEYTTSKSAFGDDKVTHFVVWYWQD